MFSNCRSLPSQLNTVGTCERIAQDCTACDPGANLEIGAVKRGCYQSILYQKAKNRPDLDMSTLQGKAEDVCSCVAGTKCASWIE